MSDSNLDIPILNGNENNLKKPPVLPYFQASSKSTSQNDNWKKFFNISFIFCIIIAFVISLYGIHKRESYNIYNNNSCSSLINNGHWISSPLKNNSYWQPETCVIKKYGFDLNSIETCLKNTNINFIGDITISRLFQYLESIVFGNITSNDDIKDKKSIERKKETTKLIYHQDNYFDSEYFNQLLNQYNSPNVRNIYILSSGKSIINNYIDPDTNEVNNEELDKAKEEWSNRFLKSLVKIQRTDHEYFIRLLTPIFNIEEDQLLAKKIVEWNDYIIQVTEDIREKDIDGKGKIHVPLSWNKLYYDSFYSYDGENRDLFIKNIVREELNLFLNSICNEKISTTDSTCCVNYPETHFKQEIILILLFIFGPLSLFYRKVIQKYYLLPSIINKYIPDDDLVINLTTIALTVYFAHFTDHTALYFKENKQYSVFKYFGLFTLAAIPIINSIETSKNTSLLNPEQVDEWHGLSLILYIIIQYCGDSNSDISNNLTRVIVSSFMFLTGYTNYYYYYRKGNFEIVNFIYYILKKVTLPLILAFALNGSMMDYFFPMMCAFWSIIIYSTMGILASYNNKRKFFLIKLGVAIGITYLMFVLLPFVTKYLFLLCGLLFGVDWDYAQWNNDVSMDFWTVWIGVGFSYLLNDIYENVDGLAGQKFKVSTLNIIGISASIGATLLCTPLLFLSNQETYNSIHPWISSVIPIAYIILRNSNHKMRKRISKFLCWVGSFVMEAYTLFNHFLVSSSTNNHGVIVYVPNSFWLNTIVSCVIFIWISAIMSHALTGCCRWVISSFFKLSLSSNSMYNQLNNSSNNLLHYDITGTVNFTSVKEDEPSTSDIPAMANTSEQNESSLDNLLNTDGQDNITLIQDPNRETLKSIQYRWFGLIILLWVINLV